MQAKYDRIGMGYNTTRKADPYIVQRLIAQLAPKEGSRYLDIGCGTGNYTSALVERGVSMIGVDPSEHMLSFARQKENRVTWLQGTVENIPLDDASCDGAIGTLTIHHWTDIQQGFTEIHRILKDGGRFILFTALPEQVTGYWLNHYFPKLMHRAAIEMPTLSLLEKTTNTVGLKIQTTEKYFIQKDLQDCFLYSGKHNPALYFNPQIRSGISSFASLNNFDEVNVGLSLLQKDIETGEIQKVQKKYENDKGDYLFVQFCKK